MLCELCRKIRPPHRRISDEGKVLNHHCIYRHHDSFAALIQSANSGCELCVLFRPFIQEAIRDDEAQNDCDIMELDDPFNDRHADRNRRQYRADEYSFYEVYDHFYFRLDDPSGYEPARNEEMKARDQAEPESALPQDALDPHPERNETLQWLQLINDFKSSPQQLWITTWRERVPRKIGGAPVRIANTILTITAGSINRDACYGESFCLDGCEFPNMASLAMKAPALWTTKQREFLTQDEDSGSFKTARRAQFEFFLKRGHLVSSFYCPLLTTADDPASVGSSIVARDIAPHAQSKSCFSLIQRWKLLCNNSLHLKCNELSTTSSRNYPARLIEVSFDNNPSHARIRRFSSGFDKLESSEGALNFDEPWSKSRRGKYLALSHCWGPNTQGMARLLKSNIEAMCDKFDITQLTRNFQDAIMVARGLQIPYLWIDALCIIQDSTEDWAKESAKMADYYGQAVMTISALSSSSSREGFLHHRTQSSIAIPITTEDGTVYLRPMLEDVLGAIPPNVDPSNFRPSMETQPLDQRAWTLQERLFSNRILHYTSQQLIFQCRSRIYSEDNQYSFTKSSIPTTAMKPLLPFPDSDIAKIVTSDTNSKPDPNILSWYSLIEIYTSRALTFASDKLPAISSAARRFAHMTGATYLAGHWHIPDDPRVFVLSLLWRQAEYGLEWDFATRLDNGVPSWSWASVRGIIGFGCLESELISFDSEAGKNWGAEIDEGFSLENSWITTRTVDEWGGVKGGGLEIIGWVHDYWGGTTFDAWYGYKARLAEVKRRLREEKMEREAQMGKAAASVPKEKDTDLSDNGQLKEGSVVKLDEDEKEVDPFGQLDIPTVGYDWYHPRHVVILVAHSVDGSGKRELPQFFLILRLAGFLEIDTTPEGDIDQEITRPLVATYERVGWAETDETFDPLPIAEKEGWRKERIILI